jgi:6-phosphofructokinase 1
MCKEIRQGTQKGKSSWIIIVAEGKAKAHDVARIISKKTGFETRVAVLGHIQRGGHPTAVDRNLATRLGHFAVEMLEQGKTDVCVNMKNDILGTIPLHVAIQAKKIKVTETYKLIKLLTK